MGQAAARDWLALALNAGAGVAGVLQQFHVAGRGNAVPVKLESRRQGSPRVSQRVARHPLHPSAGERAGNGARHRWGLFAEHQYWSHQQESPLSDYFVLFTARQIPAGPFRFLSPLQSNLNYGGSYPPGCQGWQRPTRRTPMNAPRHGPCFCTANTKYWLQLGVKRQQGPRSGLSVH